MIDWQAGLQHGELDHAQGMIMLSFGLALVWRLKCRRD